MQFQFSVCMYGTCGRIDNKADFDFFFLKNGLAKKCTQVRLCHETRLLYSVHGL